MNTEKGIWIPDSWQKDERLSVSDCAVLAKINSFASNNKGYCWASTSQLLPICNMSTSTFDRCKKRLSDLGIIEIKYAKSKFRQIYIHLDKINKQDNNEYIYSNHNKNNNGYTKNNYNNNDKSQQSYDDYVNSQNNDCNDSDELPF